MFDDEAAFAAWMDAHHDSLDEAWVGFFKKHTGKGGLAYPEAVDVCLCYGWIDGIKRRLDDERYVHRITPRRRRSNWSPTNLRRYAELEAAGRIREAGRQARRRFDDGG